jgi:hypothetical protein
MLRPEGSMAAVMTIPALTIPALTINTIDRTPKVARLKHRCNRGMRTSHAEADQLAFV